MRETDAQKKESDEMFKEFLKVVNEYCVGYSNDASNVNSYRDGCSREEQKVRLPINGDEDILDLTKEASYIIIRITQREHPKGRRGVLKTCSLLMCVLC